MQLLPIFIVVSLLGFFIILTLLLFLWQLLKAQKRSEKQHSDSKNEKPTRQFTVRDGKVIPLSDAQDTASTRKPISLDLTSPIFNYLAEQNLEEQKNQQPPKISIPHWLPTSAIDLEAQHVESIETPNLREQPKRVRSQNLSSALRTEKNGSSTVPRPSLVIIESRRPSTIKAKESQSRRASSSTGKDITDSLQKAYTGPSILGGEMHELPASPIFHAPSHNSGSRRASDRRASAYTVETLAPSSRVISDSVQRPPPLFSPVDYSPHVSFAPTRNRDPTSTSFLSMTNSPSPSEQSEPSEPSSPIVKAPPPSMIELPHHSATPSVFSRELEKGASSSTDQLRSQLTPIDTEVPSIGETSFLDSASSDNSKKLRRGVSMMSNRSVLTIASSDISSNWTIGNAQLVNIYPSVAPERPIPSYARKLRSKYGRYPRGRRDKALPVVPKSPMSPLSQMHY